jgi:copper resistance protein C
MIGWIAALFFLLTPAPLSAHAYLVKSVPAQHAVLLRAPAKIQLWFNERLEPRYSSIALSDTAGNAVAISEMAVSAEDPKQLSASVKSLPAGQYLVRYRVLSVDGHVVQDQFPFTVKP